MELDRQSGISHQSCDILIFSLTTASSADGEKCGGNQQGWQFEHWSWSVYRVGDGSPECQDFPPGNPIRARVRTLRSVTHYFTHQPLTTTADQEVHWQVCAVSGVELQLATSAGVFATHGLDPGSRLLLQTALLDTDGWVCDLGCGWGPVGCFVAATHPAVRVAMVDINLQATRLTMLNLQRNALHNAFVWCGDGLTACAAGWCGTVLTNPPVRAGNAAMGRLFDDGWRALRPGGKLWLVLRTMQGAASWQRRLQAQFGNCELMARKKGYQVFCCVR